MCIDLLFVSSYFAIDTRSIKGEIGHRYVGLYGSIIKALEAGSTVYCYSIRDYMAAGKPIVSTNLKKTAAILRRFNCGLVTTDWKSFRCHIETLSRYGTASEVRRKWQESTETFFDIIY